METKRWIDVLNWGYSGFAPMTMGGDFRKSLQQVQERLDLLDGLNYDTLWDEAKNGGGCDYLRDYQRISNDFEHGLRFMRDREDLLVKHIPAMYKGFKDCADKFRNDGLWTDEQWREYRSALSQVEKRLEDRLREFAVVYGYDTHTAPEPQRLENILPEQVNTPEVVKAFERAIKADLMEVCGNGLKWKRSKALLAYFLGHFLVNGVFLDKEFSTLFNESRLSQAYYRLADNKHGGGKPRGYEEIDRLFEQP